MSLNSLVLKFSHDSAKRISFGEKCGYPWDCSVTIVSGKNLQSFYSTLCISATGYSIFSTQTEAIYVLGPEKSSKSIECLTHVRTEPSGVRGDWHDWESCYVYGFSNALKLLPQPRYLWSLDKRNISRKLFQSCNRLEFQPHLPTYSVEHNHQE